MTTAAPPAPVPLPPPHQRADTLLLAAVGALLVLVCGVAFLGHARSPWRRAQSEAVDRVRERLGEARAASLKAGLRQIWIPELKRADRCVTCHVGIEEGQDLAGLPHPARSHPHPELLAHHPIARFGCTLCHGGDGRATALPEAHGEGPHSLEPLLSTRRAEAYGLTAAELIEIRCNACHRGQAEVAGMPRINSGKALFAARKCAGCHTVAGKGGHTGPELTHVGDEPAEHRRFPAGWRGPRTALAWHAAHIKKPTALVPGSGMRQYTFTDQQALDLALLVMSWRNPHVPPAWLPASK